MQRVFYHAFLEDTEQSSIQQKTNFAATAALRVARPRIAICNNWLGSQGYETKDDKPDKTRY